MIQNIDSLVFNLHHGKGVYALLLGSGVSKAAGIPTGWDVIQNLIRQLAVAQDEPVPEDPIAWYRANHDGEDPSYSTLLEKLAPTKAERQILLRPYFEPQTEDEREQGLKLPTAAHQAIARLVAQGVVRVILTTNFDRLLETALESEGVTPTVVRVPSDVKGIPPLTHSPCTVIKLHGDYLDTRLRNTPDELKKYPAALRSILRQVLEEYGLLVCGWSADWDTGLCDAVRAAKNHRYSMYWAAYKDQVSEEAQQLIDFRRGYQLAIESADDFFETLAERVEALEDFSAPHPLSHELTIQLLKKYVAEPRYRIRLHDLIEEETIRVGQALELLEDPSKDNGVTRLGRLNEITRTLTTLLLAGGYWATETDETTQLWEWVIRRLTRYTSKYYIDWYPSLICSYAVGLGALAGKKLVTTKRIVNLLVALPGGDQVPVLLARKVSPGRLHYLWKEIKGEHHFPLQETSLGSDCLSERLRPLAPAAISNEAQWEELFDLFELVRFFAAYDEDTSEPPYWGRYFRRFTRIGRAAHQTDPLIAVQEILPDKNLQPAQRRLQEIHNIYQNKGYFF